MRIMPCISKIAHAVPIITGTAAPVNVLGRAAKNQAFAELHCTVEVCIIKFLFYSNGDTQIYVNVHLAADTHSCTTTLQYESSVYLPIQRYTETTEY